MSDVARWLKELGLGQYVEAFADNDIDRDLLAELTDADLITLGVASLGHRKKLLRAIASPGDGNSLPPQAAGSLPPAVHPEAERRQLTVMFCDLVGSTALSELLDPEELREVIGAFQGCVARTAEGLGGRVARYMGDGLLLYFGYPRADEHDAQRAVRAGLSVIAGVSALPSAGEQPLRTRVGIATGLVVVGDLLESEMAREHVVVGETPNLAARLQALAEPDQVVISNITHRLARDAFVYEDLGARALKGFSDEVHVWRVLEQRRGIVQDEAEHGTSEPAPLVGREREIGLLRDRWEEACAHTGQVVLLSGAEGMGKTRLVKGLMAALKRDRHLTVRYFCSPYHGSSAFYPVIEQLERAARITAEDGTQDKRDKLHRLIAEPTHGGSDSLSRDAEPVLSRLLSLDPPRQAGDEPLTADQHKERTLDILVELLCAMSQVCPVLMVLEDAQWIDPTTRELFDAIVERVQDLPVLLIVNSRDDFGTRWTDYPHVSSFRLNRLAQREVDALIHALTGGKRLPEEVHERIAVNTDGIPLFVEELTRTVLESGLLVAREDRFELIGPLAPLAIPATLQDSLMARLDRLDTTKELAQTGAAIGRTFRYPLIQSVSSLDSRTLDEGLKRLEESGLLMRRGRGVQASYTFKHALMQEVAYQSMLRSRRQQLHVRIAGILADRFPEIARSQPEIVARQYTEAGLPAQAASAWLDAAGRAKDLAAYVEAGEHTDALYAVAGRLQDETLMRSYRGQSLVLRGDLESLRGDLDAANLAYEEALSLAPDPALRLDIQRRLHKLHSVRSDDARIVYYLHGSDGPTLLFVNPIAYGLALFQPILERLCSDFRVITVDCRGAGRSDPLVRPCSIERHAADTAAVVRDLGDGPVIGVGVSRGGNQLIRMEAAEPGLLRALVLVDTPSHPTGGTHAVNQEAPETETQLTALAAGDWEGLFQSFARSLFTEPAVRHLARQFVAGCHALPRETMRSFFDSDPGLDVRELLADIAYPVLVTHGTRDERVPFAMATYLQARIPGARLHAFEGKGHLPLFTAPDEFCSVLRTFVQDVMAPGGAPAPGS